MANTYEILKDCFLPQNGTLNTTPDNEQEIFNAVWDTENHALRVNISGGTGGAGLWEEGDGAKSAKLISQNCSTPGINSVAIGDETTAGGITYGTTQHYVNNAGQSSADFKGTADVLGLSIGDTIEILDSLGNQLTVGVTYIQDNGDNTFTISIDPNVGKLRTFTDILFSPILSPNDFSMGYKTSALGGNSFATGDNNIVSGENSAIIGGSSQTLTDNNTVMVPNLYINDNLKMYSNGTPILETTVPLFSSDIKLANNNGSMTFNANSFTFNNNTNIEDGYLHIRQAGEGIILVSPNGTVYKITIDNSGNIVSTIV